MADSGGNLAFFVATGVLGAIIGGIAGYASTGTWQGALTGAAVGGAIGLAGGALAANLIAGSATAGTGTVFSCAKSALGVVSTKTHASWKAAEQSLRTSMNSVQSTASRTFRTPWGNRIADAFNQGLRKIGESKYGYQGLSSSIRNQIQKDAWLLQNDPRVKAVEWHFFHSAVSNSHGMSDNLRAALTSVGIKIVEHYLK